MSNPWWQLLDGPVITADCRDALSMLPACCVDAVVTDPPYEIGFMGKTWDASGIAYSVEWWQQVLRVLKPGGHLLAFGAPRTYHRLTVAVEDAGFEIRDCLLWLHGEGFPKSKNVALAIDKSKGAADRGRAIPMASVHFPNGVYEEGKRKLKANPVPPYEAQSEEAAPWLGWGTCLKPAYEPVLMARKPLAGTLVEAVLEHGTGALNIEATKLDGGRWPPHVMLDEEAAAMLDGQSGECNSSGHYEKGALEQGAKDGPASIPIDGLLSSTYADEGGASRFMYVAKAKRDEREAGLADMPLRFEGAMNKGLGGVEHREGEARLKRNTHTTVKPIELMQWLVRMVTPPGGVVLDPMAGSGTTGCAAAIERIDFAGVELHPEYAAIANARIAFWEAHPPGATAPSLAAADRERVRLEAMGQLELG